MTRYWISRGETVEGPDAPETILAMPDWEGFQVCPQGEREWRPAALELLPKPEITRPSASSPRSRARHPVLAFLRWVALVLFSLVLGGILIGGYAAHRLGYTFADARAAAVRWIPTSNRIRPIAGEGDFDLSFALPGDPMGMGWDGTSFVIGNRTDPWGFLRLRPDGAGGFRVEKIPVREPTYDQTINLDAVAWDGRRFVAYTTASWFQLPEGRVFTFHDPATLGLAGHAPAPPLLGALVWDQTGYWAGSRKNTEAAPEEAWLFRLDENLAEVSRYPPPGPGCQGLAWDGRRLWWADVFTDRIHILEVADGVPSEVSSHAAPFGYLSGIAFDGRSIWVTEYGEKRLHRLSDTAYAEWTGEAPPSAAPASGAGAPEASARYENSFDPETGAEEVDLRRFELEIQGDRLVGSWEIFIGPGLFHTEGEKPAEPGAVTLTIPKFVKLEATVEGKGTGYRREIEIPVVPGTNIRRGEVLAEGLAPGKYSASFFVHAHYVDESGTSRILNASKGYLEVGR